jgi:hypothetical protein
MSDGLRFNVYPALQARREPVLSFFSTFHYELEILKVFSRGLR